MPKKYSPLLALLIAAICIPTLSQPAIPETFRQLMKPEIAERCFYYSFTMVRLTSELHEVDDERYKKPLFSHAINAETWREKAVGVSIERYALDAQRSVEKIASSESNRISQYCMNMGYSEFTQAPEEKQKVIMDRALQRILEQKNKKPLRHDFSLQ